MKQYSQLLSSCELSLKVKHNHFYHVTLKAGSEFQEIESPPKKNNLGPGTAMGCSMPENALFYLYSHNFIDAKY